jgi:hypothetical protein
MVLETGVVIVVPCNTAEVPFNSNLLQRFFRTLRSRNLHFLTHHFRFETRGTLPLQRNLLFRGGAKRMPSLLVVQKLAAALDTTMADLMRELEGAGADGPPPESPGRKKRAKA